MRRILVLACGLYALSCASKPASNPLAARDGGAPTAPATDGGGSSGSGDDGGTSDGGGGTGLTELPADPVLAAGAPSDAPELFAVEGPNEGGPCVVEPEPGSLFPRNWLRPRFRWVAPQGDNLFELRIIVDNQPHPFVVYTTETTYTMPSSVWVTLTQHSADMPIYYSVRSARYDGSLLESAPRLGTSDSFQVAPVIATGQIVYWTTTSGTALKGFSVGDEDVREVLRPAQAGERARCVGCHTSTPDGRYAAFSTSRNATDGNPSRVRHRSVDGTASEPSYITPSARALLEREPQQQPFFSRGQWGEDRRTIFSMLNVDGRWEIVWTNLLSASEARGTGWGVVAREGDPGSAASATMRNDGTGFAYASGANVTAGVIFYEGGGDLYTVPYNDGRGGRATPIPGASDPAWNEYTPAFSPDDRLLAFNRVPNAEVSYNNPHAEIFVLPAEGGTPVRLRANDPSACLPRSSPGVTNSWPKWSPSVAGAGSRTFYWLTFSSTRAGAGPQIYVAPVVLDGDTMTTYPALTLWNQPAEEANHTAAWDVFKIR
jgi:hypothetical protein